MPRRKGQGISPTKRTQNNKDGGVQARKKQADISEEPAGTIGATQPSAAGATKSGPDVAPAPPEVANSKYLHKKFKKLATSSPTQAAASHKSDEQVRPLEVIINGLVKAQKEAMESETRAAATEAAAAALDSSALGGKGSGGGGGGVVFPGPVVPLPSQGRYVCPYCKLACAKPSVLQKHIRAHTNERPYPCGPCGFAFKTKSNLYKHCRSRAHALKMEEHGSKFACPLEEASDLELEDEENDSNNSAFLAAGPLHAVSAPASVGSTSPTLPTAPPPSGAADGGAEKRAIYKPKFHKAAMYHEEEDAQLQQQQQQQQQQQTSKKGGGGGLSLEIPVALSLLVGNVGNVLSKTPSSPSSEFLQRRISKIISENQAIVETMDPLWPKKHSRQREKEGGPASPLSASTSPGLDRLSQQEATTAAFPKKFYQRQASSSEPGGGGDDRAAKSHHAAHSKLALALLRPNLPVSPRTADCPAGSAPDPAAGYSQQPLNLTTTHHAKDDGGAPPQRKLSLADGLLGGNMPAKQGTVLKDQNALNNRTLNSKGRLDDATAFADGMQKNTDKFFHSQNPEGSIIKDLLLKTRAAYVAGLSGSMQGFQDLSDSEILAVAAYNSKPVHFQLPDEFAGGLNAQYVCQLCKIPYRNAENLEIHQLYYCKGDGLKQPVSPQHSPNSKYGSSSRDGAEETSFAKVKTSSAKGKAKLDLKISAAKDGPKICQPFPSPGPLLGSTPLVESYYYGKSQDDDAAGRPHKKQRLDSESSSRGSPNSLHEVRCISSPFAAMSTGGTTTLRSLEELSKCPMRPNSLQMFGGEVSIVDGAGETKTMRIEPRGKSPSASDYLSLPNVHQAGVIAKADGGGGGDGRSSSSPHVVTIARSGLNSGGTIVHSPLKANAALSLVKPPRSSGGSVSSRSAPSPITLSPMQRTPQQSVGSPPNTPFSTANYFSHNSPTLTASYPDTPKLMPNIATLNLAVPGIPAPSMSHHLPYLPFTSILPDGTRLNPLSNITAFNPLTLPPHSAILHANLLNLSAKDRNSSDASYQAGVVPILHGGKVIPYVQGMPGPQTLMATSPNLGARKALSPKPLDLASPSKDQLPTFKMEPSHNSSHQQMHILKKKFKSSAYPHAATVIQSSHRKAPSKELSSPRVLTLKPSAVSLAPSSTQSAKPPVAIPSIKVDTISPGSDSSSTEEVKRPAQSPRKPSKRSEHVGVGAKETAKDVEDESTETEVDASQCGQSRGKFLRPTSLPLKPGTFVPKQHRGLTPLGGVLSLVSPETPRPKKSYGQLYLNGHSYTYLALKCSTRPFHCTLNRPQPMYVQQTPEHSKLSMYSNWKVCSEADPHPLGLDPGKAMAFYDSRLHRVAAFTVATPAERLPMTLTHSSYWVNKQLAPPGGKPPHRDGRPQGEQREGSVEGIENLSLGESPPKRVKIFDGGFESNEDYIYVRGRGRGRYVCEECGIRCKKPSMLKKHIRTHTDVRPFTCKHCSFSFKTKGNLTKHMKSKAHYKKCVELGIVPVPTIVDDSYIDEECLARQQALRASRHGNGETDSDENEEDDEEDEDDDEDDDDMADDEGRLEREAACSLLSLAESTRFGSSTNHRYLSLGLIPLPSIIARPTTYPYVLTFALPKPNHQVTEPQTPTLTNLTAQTENEKVSRNTGLALELREDTIGKALRLLNRRNSSALVQPTGEKNRCYFPSRRTPTLVKSVSDKSWSDEDSDGYEYDNSDGLTDDSDMSDGDDRVRPERNDGGRSQRCDKEGAKGKELDRDNGELKELHEDKNVDKHLRVIMQAANMERLQKMRESYEQSVGIKSRDEAMDVDAEEKNSSGPMDLSSKSMSLTRKLSLTLPYYANGTNGARTPTTPISEILTPVSEPAVLASLCSSMERFPVPQTLPAKLAVDVKETTMLQAYLTEKALQDVRVKQRQHRHNQGYSVLIRAKDGWVRPQHKEETVQPSQVNLKPIQKLQGDQASADILVSILQVSKDASKCDAESLKQVEGTGRERNTSESSSKSSENPQESGQEPPKYLIQKNPESLVPRLDTPKNSSENDQVVENSVEGSESTASKTDDVSSSADSSAEKVVASVDTVKLRDQGKAQSVESVSEKLACVSMANSMVRNVVVGGSAFDKQQPSSPPNAGNNKKSSSSPGKPKAEFMPPSSGPSSSYCSVLEDGRSVCVICNKIFSKPSQLRLHVNIHYFERPFRCESCAVSFRTKGHLQKHERSVSHQNKVSMNSTFGAATTTNPRPFKCDDCKIAFRIHGHLAKHLRSKMHIMKLECVGKLPFGTYAEMEREGVSLNDIDTSDCDNSLESLQMLAQKLYEKDPSKLGQWDGERGELLNPNPILSGGDSSSDEGEPCVSPPPPMQCPELIPPELLYKSLSLAGRHDPHPDVAGPRGISCPDGQPQLSPRQQSPRQPSPRQPSPRQMSPRQLAVSMQQGGEEQEQGAAGERDDHRVKDSSSGEPSRKRKSVDELDHADTSDEDNEAGSTYKIVCPSCLQEFRTAELREVHFFMHHSPFTKAVPNLMAFRHLLRNERVTHSDPPSCAPTNTDAPKQLCQDTVIEFTTNQGSKNMPVDNKHPWPVKLSPNTDNNKLLTDSSPPRPVTLDYSSFKF